MAEDQLGSTASIEMQKNFAEAYNRGDVDAMAAVFTENAVRVTPSGIFHGRVGAPIPTATFPTVVGAPIPTATFPTVCSPSVATIWSSNK
jgi:hypothetical protein